MGEFDDPPFIIRYLPVVISLFIAAIIRYFNDECGKNVWTYALTIIILIMLFVIFIFLLCYYGYIISAWFVLIIIILFLIGYTAVLI